MVARLKAECGNALTAKLEGMFQDIKTSAETIVGFKSFLSGLQVVCQTFFLSVWTAKPASSSFSHFLLESTF